MNREMQQSGPGRGETLAGGFEGHLRVRRAAPGEIPGFAVLFEDPDRRRWVAETLAARGSKALVVERFAGTRWVPVGRTVTDADGETAVALDPRDRGRGLAHEVLRAGVRVLHEEPFLHLSATVVTGDAGAARVFEKAGFTPAGPCRFRGRPATRWIRNLRGDCTPYNVWI